MTTYYLSIVGARENGDPFGEELSKLPSHVQRVVNEDMKLTGTVQESFLRGSAYIDRVRWALPAAARLQGIAMVLNCATAAQHYGVLVGTFVQWLQSKDDELRRYH